jgi:hypothetical protein
MVPGQWVPVVVVAQQRRVEDLRDVAEAGDLVSARPAREELAVARPEGFFEGEEALALDEGAFDLAVVDGGVDGVADVLVGVSGRMREVGECLDLPS